MQPHIKQYSVLAIQSRLLILLLILILLHSYPAKAEPQAHSFKPRPTNLIAPERGFYTFRTKDKYGYPHYANLATDRTFDWVRREGFSLVSSRISLEQFRNSPLSPSFLHDLATGFAALRLAKIKVILRFNYNNGNAPGDDASMDVILRHISQLTPVLKENADLILAIQAGFIGAWGEWHSSTNGLDTADARRAVIDALLGAIPQGHFLQIRNPQHKIELLQNEQSSDASALDSYQSRLGFHIDCILASTNDLTYPPGKIEFYNHYVENESILVPVGGETCRLNAPRTDCQTAMEVLRKQHFTYLNNDFEPAVIQHWVDTGCYEQIKEHLGYSLRAQSAAYDQTVSAGAPLQITLAVENTGWAAPVHERRLIVEIISPTGTPNRFVTDVSLRSFRPGTIVSNFAIPLPKSIPAGSYDLFVSAPDSSERLAKDAAYSIPFQNVEYDENAGHLRLGSIDILAPE